jgi:hypothetical protein
LLDKGLSAEQAASARLIKNVVPSNEDLQILQACTNFYRQCFTALKQIDLHHFNSNQATQLKVYLNSVFTAQPFLHNDLTVSQLYRATIVDEKFLEEGKVRDKQYLTYPPINIVNDKGYFNRCSSPQSTLFYGCERPNVTIREIKPEKGRRVIISTWMNRTGKLLHYMPICLAPGIHNSISDSATLAFEQLYGKQHPIVIDWMQAVLSFIASEFIKESEPAPFRYDYYFSAFFAERMVQHLPLGSGIQDVDCVVYPSVAWNHRPSNVAVLPNVLDNNFALVSATEYEVGDTWYDRDISVELYPAGLHVIRNSLWVRDGRIIWEDD